MLHTATGIQLTFDIHACSNVYAFPRLPSVLEHSTEETEVKTVVSRQHARAAVQKLKALKHI